MYTRKCFVKPMLGDQDDLSTDALTLHPRLLREGLGDKAQSLTRGPWNQVVIRGYTWGIQVWAWAHVALGAASKDITGTVLAKMSARRVPLPAPWACERGRLKHSDC